MPLLSFWTWNTRTIGTNLGSSVLYKILHLEECCGNDVNH